MSNDDDDSIMIQVEMSKEEKAKGLAVIHSFEYLVDSSEPFQARVYMVVSEVYLRNLLSKRQEPNIPEASKKRLGLQCIIHQEFTIEWITEDGRHWNKQPYRTEISIYHLQYRGLEVVLRLGEMDINSDDSVHGKLTYHSAEKVEYKTYRMEAKSSQHTNAYSFIIEDKLFDTYFKPRLAIEFTIHKELPREKSFRGIQNQGSTCYMNSTLQILYFLRPLRKTILDFDGKSNLMRAIKRILIDLLDVSQETAYLTSVDASELLSAYGRFPDPRKQQDIHEFLLGFLDELQGECPQLKQLWLGNGRQILNSRDPQKPYVSTIAQDFNEIDLHLEDHLGNTLWNLQQALEKLLQEQIMDVKIDTDQYGKVDVGKMREFGALPNVVFFNLKRYKYRRLLKRATKILTEFEYPYEIDLGFLQKTPSGVDEDYVLFGVAVHRGQAYNSGHYYSIINTAKDPNEPYWVKFNDSIVLPSSRETALSFKGGKGKQIKWSREFQRFVDTEFVSEETAYLLVYIRREKFAEYQSIPTTIPRDWVLKRKAEHKMTASKTTTIQVLVIEQSSEYDIFDQQAPRIPLDLNDDELLTKELKRIGQSMLGIKVGSIWKVNRAMRKIKKLSDHIDIPQTISKIFAYRRGHSTPDFFLVVPDTHSIYRSKPSHNDDKLGVVSIVTTEDNFIKRWFRVLPKASLQDFKTQEEIRLKKRGYIEERDKDRFEFDWTDYCVINLQ